jgi:hypothetical protein
MARNSRERPAGDEAGEVVSIDELGGERRGSGKPSILPAASKWRHKVAQQTAK